VCGHNELTNRGAVRTVEPVDRTCVRPAKRPHYAPPPTLAPDRTQCATAPSLLTRSPTYTRPAPIAMPLAMLRASRFVGASCSSGAWACGVRRTSSAVLWSVIEEFGGS
jgi:hypothetical protein